MTISSVLITVLRVLLGVILLFAGIAKLSGFTAFALHVASYQLLPIALVKPISYLVVSAEITLGVILCIGYFSRGAGLLASLLFLLFAVAVATVLWRELPLTDCGCVNFLFNLLLDRWDISMTTAPSWQRVFGNVVLAGGSFAVTYSPQRGYGLESSIR